MKTKFLVLLFMMALSFLVKAEPKSYLRDESECILENKKFSLEIRSPDLYTQGSESEYGDSIFIRTNGKRQRIVMNETDIGRYRILNLYNDICSKVMTLSIKEDEVAFLLLKDNRPFPDLLTILYYNVRSKLSEVVDTKISVKLAFRQDGKVYLRHSKDHTEQKFGSMVLDNVKYNFTEKPFEPWVSFDGRHFKMDREMSYDRFEYNYLLTKESFAKFQNLNSLSYKLARNGNKTCLSFEKSPWYCK